MVKKGEQLHLPIDEQEAKETLKRNIKELQKKNKILKQPMKKLLIKEL